MPDVEWLELKRIFLNTSIENLSAVCFSALTRQWRSFADHVHSLVHAHVRTGKVIRDTKDNAWESHWYQGTDYGANQQAPNCEQLRCVRG